MQPLTLAETLDASIRIVRARWRTLVLVMLVVVVPIQLASLAVTAATTDAYTVTSTFGDPTNVRYSNRDAYVTGQVVVAVLTLMSYLLGTVACYRAVADTYLDRPTTAGESLRFALSRLGPALWLTILFTAGVVVGLFGFLVPGIWLAIAWSVAFPALLVEGLGGSEALRRSYRLTQGRWWPTFGRFIVAYVLAYVVSTVITVVVLSVALVPVDDQSFAALTLQHVGAALGSVLATPLLAAVTVLVYFDLRVRKEGFDPRRLSEAATQDAETFSGYLPPASG